MPEPRLAYSVATPSEESHSQDWGDGRPQEAGQLINAEAPMIIRAGKDVTLLNSR
jgi:hypothetical protein